MSEHIWFAYQHKDGSRHLKRYRKAAYEEAVASELVTVITDPFSATRSIANQMYNAALNHLNDNSPLGEWEEGPPDGWQGEREDDRTDEDDPSEVDPLAWEPNDDPTPTRTLFDFFAEEHGLTLTEGQLTDIVHAVEKYW